MDFSRAGVDSQDAGVYVDIDAARCGNEGRFVNDHSGTGLPPNAQFWTYFDPSTGERRMAVKSIKPIAAGQEVLVDYGGSYFERDSSSDSDMHSSDSEFEGESKSKRPKKKQRVSLQPKGSSGKGKAKSK